jgi:hypothetical protein
MQQARPGGTGAGRAVGRKGAAGCCLLLHLESLTMAWIRYMFLMKP